MNYNIKVNKLENKDWSTKAFVSIVFEESLKVTDITVKEARNEDLFSYKTKQKDEQEKAIYQDVCYPVTKKFWEMLYGEMFDYYNRENQKVATHFIL